MAKKLWGGRFTTGTDPLVEQFTSSIAVDFRLATYDMLGSIAHAKMLGKCRIIPSTASARIVAGLTRLLREVERGRLKPDASAEDVHTQIESALAKSIGPVAGMLHTARSRNDQVALDIRLYCRDAVQRLRGLIRSLQAAWVDVAAANIDVVIPGYTHLQRAQPILFAHHVLAYVEMLARDDERLRDAATRIDVLPLGSGALAGTSLPIDRAYVAKLLGFSRVADNSLDAVSDRDFAIELLAALALIAMHLSRFAEDAILWATEEFGIVALDERFATGSSLMPQKKNPDVLELIRGQAGPISGDLVALLMVLKGLPLAYNRDLQWDKPVLFDAVDRTEASLAVLAKMVRSLRIRRDRAARLLEHDALCATDLAEHLVRRGVAFREAHGVVGRLVLDAERSSRSLRDYTLTQLQQFSPRFDREALSLTNPRKSVERKVSVGGTGPRQVAAALRRWQRRLTTSSSHSTR